MYLIFFVISSTATALATASEHYGLAVFNGMLALYWLIRLTEDM
jgi:hypothetical protein